MLVIGFADDVLMAPHLSREVADAIPNGRYLEIPDAGHLGFIEQPEVVNEAILEFFAESEAIGCTGEPLDDSGPHRRRRTDSRRRA